MQQPWGPSTFTVERPVTDKFMPSGGWSTVVAPVSPWAATQAPKPPYADDEALKKTFGIEWAKCGKPFEAACKVFEKDTSAALWIAANWQIDPIVVAAKDIYTKAVDDEMALLDRDDFAIMLMKTAKEGKLEDKELINILKLYADVRGFLNKDTTNINNFNNNEGLKVVFVKAAPVEQPKLVEQVPNHKSEILNDQPLPLRVKLVGNG